MFRKEVRIFTKKKNIFQLKFYPENYDQEFLQFASVLRYVCVLIRGPCKKKFFDNQDIRSWRLNTTVVGSRCFSSRHFCAICAEAIALQRIPLFW